MHSIVCASRLGLLLACLASGAHGRHTPTSGDHLDGNQARLSKVSTPLKTLAIGLFAFYPTAAFLPSFPNALSAGGTPSHAPGRGYRNTLMSSKYQVPNDIEVDTATGIAEGRLLERSQRLPWPPPSSEALRDEGVVLIPGVLSTATAAAFREHCESRLATALAEVDSGAVDESHLFGDVLVNNNRYDLKLTLEPIVVDMLAEALKVLGPYFRRALGADEPHLVEFGAMRTTHGSPRQPIHPDTYTPCDVGPALLTAFVALQDIDEQMGPTTFLPGTHTDMQARVALSMDFLKPRMIQSTPVRFGSMPAGSCTLYDTRTLHAGGANNSPHKRWLFYATFASPEQMLQYELLDYWRKQMVDLGVHTLGELERRAVRSDKDAETTELRAKWSKLFQLQDESPQERH